MTPAKRIFLNVAATYGRSLVALAAGVFTGRWLLMALGETDYGLYGLVGALTVLVAFFNYLLAASVERFYAVAAGAGDLAEQRRWFSIALAAHVAVAVVMTALAYPIGRALIVGFLSIPPDRVAMCVEVFGFVVLDAFVGFVTVPFSAVFTARQKIAELTVFGLFQTLANVAVLGWMVTHPGTWLVVYAGAICAIRVVPALILTVIAVMKFPECRFRAAFVFDRERVVRFVGFTSSRFCCLLGQILSTQGLAVVVNKYLGVARNASLAVGHTVLNNANMLAGAMTGAFAPALMNLAGAGELGKMRDAAFRTSLFSTLGILAFAIPLALEMELVLELWLETPPAGAAGLCLCFLAVVATDKLTEGHVIALSALGDIRRSQLGESATYLGAFLLGWALVAAGYGLLAMGLAVVLGKIAGGLVKLHYGRTLAELSVEHWARTVLAPVALVAVAAVSAGLVPRLLLAPTFARAVLTGLASVTAATPFVWFFALTSADRAIIRSKLRLGAH